MSCAARVVDRRDLARRGDVGHEAGPQPPAARGVVATPRADRQPDAGGADLDGHGHDAEVRLIDDNPDDAELTHHALRNSGIANNISDTADRTTVCSRGAGAN